MLGSIPFSCFQEGKLALERTAFLDAQYVGLGLDALESSIPGDLGLYFKVVILLVQMILACFHIP